MNGKTIQAAGSSLSRPFEDTVLCPYQGEPKETSGRCVSLCEHDSNSECKDFCIFSYFKNLWCSCKLNRCVNIFLANLATFCTRDS